MEREKETGREGRRQSRMGEGRGRRNRVDGASRRRRVVRMKGCSAAGEGCGWEGTEQKEIWEEREGAER